MVGSFPDGASWCGALDLAGNAWEWCADWYGDKYYSETPPRDPTGPPKGSTRVLRGGSYQGNVRACRSTARSSDFPRLMTSDCPVYGFRCMAPAR